MELRMRTFILFVCNGFITVLDAACKSDEWTCKDGSCIDAKLKCNGAYDCRDKSDETFVLCSQTICNYGKEFQCAYGGCLKNISLSCNGVQDCVDNSDELLPRCRNDTTFHECAYEHDTCQRSAGCSHSADSPLPICHEVQAFQECRIKKVDECYRKDNTCKDGTYVTPYRQYIKCDGVVDCEDGSDETLESCSADWIHNCIGWKFRCQYGGCIEKELACNGVVDCFDGSDELKELCEDDGEDKIKLSSSDWLCKDGNRINEALKCNGKVDCPDGSDETVVECSSTNRCPFKYSKCIYGACIKNSLFCNGERDCADNSDELLRKCRNESTYDECVKPYVRGPDFKRAPGFAEYNKMNVERCDTEERLCNNGQLLGSRQQKCDGKVDCADGSDETLETCASTHNRECSFRCRNGGCILDSRKVCDKVKDCSDGTDELASLCFKDKCVLPEYPAHGTYSVLEQPATAPGQTLDVALLVYSCDVGYKLHGTSPYVNCLKGNWPYAPPKCLAQCKLEKHNGTLYWCLAQARLLEGRGELPCGELVPEGSTVRPECSAAIYHYSAGVLPFLHCEEGGFWNRPVPTCSPQCGLKTTQGNKLIINGRKAKLGEFPWHAGIYNKRKRPYEQICGGSLISQTIVVSAAHCFWSDFQVVNPVRFYAVALGKLYRPWDNTHEVDEQKFDVSSIKVPPRFKGAATNLQDDIALVFLSSPAQYRAHVLPVCLDFSATFERRQLVAGNFGKVTGWGLTAEDGKAAPVLQTADVPFIDVNVCYEESPPDFIKFITSDKICAGNGNKSALCHGDSGGGLVFASRERGEDRYFLRGLVSAAPRNDHLCNAAAHTTFTLLSKHQAFILQYWTSE